MALISHAPRETGEAPEQDLSDVITRARAAQGKWAALGLDERTHRIRALGPKTLARAEEIARTLREETGKPETEALAAEVLPVADIADYWTHQIEQLLEPADIELDPIAYPRKSGRIERVPHGLLALITPYSFPFVLPLRHMIPALLAGNAILFKPSDRTPLTANLVASLFADVLPPDLLTVLVGGADVGRALVRAGVDAVCFTGSVTSGRDVAVACARDFVPCSLELGGKNPAIVLDDAPIERTAQGIVWAAFANAGQSSASIERVYVARPIADKLTERIVAITKTLRPEIDYGPLAVDERMEIVTHQLSEAVKQGAEVLTGGAPEATGSRLFPPTVVRLADHDATLLREETFGPVLPIVAVDDAEQAIERANALPQGLTASVWTSHPRKGQTLARRIRAGVVTINNHGFTASLPAAPWSGVGHSGNAIVHGPFALEGYTRPKLTLTDGCRRSRELWWYPYDDTFRRLLLQTARMRSGGWFGRIAAFFCLLVLLPKRWLGR
jgi:acyl-CoA reductase-like NAD-dependent aldehyde dehydrogenase